MLYSGTDPESYITEYTLVYEDKWYQDTYISKVLYVVHGTRKCFKTHFPQIRWKSATHREKSREWNVSKQKWNLC